VSAPPVATLRLATAAAALVLAVASRGDALGLSALLVVATWHLPSAVAIVLALAGSSWRWGSTSLEALAGAQAVLGPAGWTGSAAGAASSWLAAGAVVLAAGLHPTPGRDEVGARAGTAPAPRTSNLVLAVAAGATAAAIVAGPAPGGVLVVRVLAGLVATGVVLVLLGRGVRHRAGVGARAMDIIAVAAGLGAVLLASVDAPAWSGTVDGGALRVGALLAVAVGALVAVGGSTVGAMGNREA
jgi:hypothetical protein